jgi:hypothetical protein
MDVYVYQDGFMYYTKQKFVKGDISRENNITTGYIDRQVYQENPLTHEDFRAYLDSERDLTSPEKHIKYSNKKISDVIFNRIYELIKNIMLCYRKKLDTKKSKFYDNITYQLFGADVSINDKLQPQIMEINKGPDLGAKDERDRNVKYGLVQDIFKIVGGIEKCNENKFKLILDLTKRFD